ncbi:MAG: C4-dicarboxylate TRAP transporter substrate-binding protein, partial [Pseudomonadota bacterium]
MKTLIVIVAALLFIPLLAGGAWAKTFKLTIGCGGAADPLPFIKMLRDFYCPEVSKRVEAATGHKIEWSMQWAGAVAKLGEEFEAVQMGLLDVAMVFPIFENPQLFIHNFSYYAPFGTPDVNLATKINMKVYDTVPWLKEVFEKKYKQKWVASVTYETYNMLTNFEWKTIDDLKGHKIAAAGPNLPWIKTVGCVPVQGNVMEAYTGLQTKVYDGWVLPDSIFYGFKLIEVAKYATNVGFGCISGPVVTVNLELWKSLPPEVQKIMLEVGPEYSVAVAKETDNRHQGAIKAIKEKGGLYYDLPLKDKQEWMKRLGNLADEKAKEADKLGQPGTEVLKT